MNEPLWDEMDVVEDALCTWPRAQAPRGFSSRVLQRIDKTPRPAIQFRLTWLDVALGLFTVSIPPVLLFIWNSLPLTILMRLQFQISVFQNMPWSREILFLTVLGAAGLFILLTLAVSLFTSPAVIESIETAQAENPG